ncbi:hypothetical protein YYC_04808 [Plasmodium yoelii 17X]|uniref:YIR protein n=1 Tax=Plasmodium yoelii 17X TaxID=1323249 RepID=V7PE65_PLAYE|nr:hypothetical protein YYC_04808 [Plasmodium yoelii 17X]
MLTSRVCGEFDTLRKFFPDELDESGNYKFTKGLFTKYCSNNNCDSGINTVNASLLWLFNQFYGDCNNFSKYADDKISVTVYIMVWLGNKLNKMLNTKFSNLNEFYSNHMQTVNEYKQLITGVTDYTSYIDLINKHNYVLEISNENMSKFYDAFKNLCNMINNADKKDNGKSYLEYANKFVDEYEKLFNDNNNVEGNSYNKLLCTMSNDYTVFGKTVANPKMRNKLPDLTTKKKTQITSSPNVSQMDTSSPGTSTSRSGIEVSSSETEPSDSDSVSPSSSILNKLILIPIIFVATLISLGIAYKYSLFGFRKRTQKQHLREKIKK